MVGKLRIKLVGSSASRPRKVRNVLKGLGLTRLGKVVEREDTPSIRGMVLKVQHLVEVEKVEE
ncbi:MAG: 50S ribosomal protein L30 [Deltaproteobacteria bacterium]|nr:50S ribosomal protein L30 [Deltaproteobacteria bacterium]